MMAIWMATASAINAVIKQNGRSDWLKKARLVCRFFVVTTLVVICREL